MVALLSELPNSAGNAVRGIANAGGGILGERGEEEEEAYCTRSLASFLLITLRETLLLNFIFRFKAKSLAKVISKTISLYLIAAGEKFDQSRSWSGTESSKWNRQCARDFF